MEHLEFINQLSKIGVGLRGTTIEGAKRYEIVRPFSGEKDCAVGVLNSNSQLQTSLWNA